MVGFNSNKTMSFKVGGMFLSLHVCDQFGQMVECSFTNEMVLDWRPVVVTLSRLLIKGY